MKIVKEKLEIDEELEKKINNLLKFSGTGRHQGIIWGEFSQGRKQDF